MVEDVVIVTIARIGEAGIDPIQILATTRATTRSLEVTGNVDKAATTD